MSYFPIENTYNGFNVNPNYYASSDAAASPTLYRSISQNTPPVFTPTLNPATSSQYYNQIMSAQQSLYSGWSSFCGQPQQGGSPTQTQSCHPPQEIHVHRHHIRGADGQMRTITTRSAADPRQTGGPFGHCGQTASRSCRPYAFGSRGCFGGQPTSHVPPSGYGQGYPTGTPGSWNTGNYGGPNYGGQSSYGSQPSYGAQFGSLSGYGSQSSYNYGQPALSYPALPQLPYSMPQNSFDYSNNFSSYFNNNSSSPFGIVPSAYAGYNGMGSFGAASLLGSALSLLF